MSVPVPHPAERPVAPLAERFLSQAAYCLPASPLTAALLEGAARDLARPGPVRDLLAPLAADPPGSVAALRFAGALHRLVLERRAPALALHYPSVGGRPDLERVWPIARDVVAELDGTPLLPELMKRGVQTNEVGRSAVLLGGLLHVVRRTDLPVRLLEIGASAGLNLRVDHYAYQVGADIVGDRDSPVVLRQPWTGDLPPYAPLEIVARAGCDPDPLDAMSAEDRLTLTSYVWPDQLDRLARLRGAFVVAQRVPATVEATPASAFLQRELAEPVPGVATVVWHSVVWQYLRRDERASVDATLADAGSRATAEAPLARLSLEPRRVSDQELRFSVTLTLWPGGEPRTIATAGGHGPPVAWRGGLEGWDRPADHLGGSSRS